MPKRRNGTESVTTLGVTSRMTMTSDGLDGTSLDDMVLLRRCCARPAKDNMRGVAMRTTSRFLVARDVGLNNGSVAASSVVGAVRSG